MKALMNPKPPALLLAALAFAPAAALAQQPRPPAPAPAPAPARAAAPVAAPAPAAPPPAATPAPAAAEVPLAEERPWAVTCAPPAAGAARDCQITATLLLRQNQARLARVVLRRQPESRSLTMVFQLPHGAWLPGGVQWQVDEGEAQRLAFQTSDGEGLYAGIAVTDDILASLRRGTSLRLAAVVAAQRQMVNIPISLGRLNEAFGEFTTQEAAR